MAERVTKAVKAIAVKPVIMKLSPNVTDITEIARACESGGADGLSLINTLLGMQIDVNKGKFVLANETGGLSGPAIKPVAIRMVYQVTGAVDLPIIGVGGIISGEDVVEFLMAGAKLVEIGTAALINPTAPIRIKRELIEYMERKNIKNIADIKRI